MTRAHILLRLPRFWRGMGFTAKAAYLASSGQARDYAHACSILSKLPRRPKPRDLRPQAVAEMERRGLW